MTGLFDKVGITTETIERGKNSGLFSSSGKFTDSQREVVKKMMEDMYGQFTDEGREGSPHAGREAPRSWPAAACTRVGRPRRTAWSIELGTLHDAMAEAKKLAGLDADAEVTDRSVCPSRPTSSSPSSATWMPKRKRESAKALDQRGAVNWSTIAAACGHRLRAVFDRPVAFMMPFELDITVISTSNCVAA